MKQLYTFPFYTFNVSTPPTWLTLIGTNHKGYRWVLRDVTVAGHSGVSGQYGFRMAIQDGKPDTTSAGLLGLFIDWSWSASAPPPNNASPMFHWNGTAVLPPGAGLYVAGTAGRVQGIASGWRLTIPETTTTGPPPHTDT